jgi:ketosteroid isomerase-like protein
MASVDDVDRLIEHYQLAFHEFVKGNPEPAKQLFSYREDVTLANPLGPPARGWEQVTKTIEHAASNIRDGEISGFDVIWKLVTPELAYTVWIERQKAKMGGRQDVTPVDLRVTMIYRPEEGEWKVVHRHADPITTARPAETVIQEQLYP